MEEPVKLYVAREGIVTDGDAGLFKNRHGVKAANHNKAAAALLDRHIKKIPGGPANFQEGSQANVLKLPGQILGKAVGNR